MRLSFSKIIEALAAGAACALALTVAPFSAHAQSQPVPPEHYTLDPRGVDLVSGLFNYGTTEVTIGQPGAGGLSYGRVYTNSGWRDTSAGSISAAGADMTISVGPISEPFVNNGVEWVSKYGNGSTWVWSGTIGTLTDRNGNVATFDQDALAEVNAYGADLALITGYASPDGATVTYHWKKACVRFGQPGDFCLQFGVRLQSITNNHGYMLKYVYWSDVGTNSGWLRTRSVTGVNLAVDYCDPVADACPTYSRVWPSVRYDNNGGSPPLTATDQANDTTTYTYGAAGLTGIRYPGTVSNDVVIGYTPAPGAMVAVVSDASGTWTYDWSTTGTTQTTTVAGPLGQGLTVQTDLTIGRATMVTDALSHAWSYQYDADLRLTRVTQPEGDYTTFAYDARSNPTVTTAIPKPGAPVSSVTTTITYPTTCTNPVTCNRPVSTTDPRGGVTDYVWDATHGGLLSVTAPAPSTGATRPRTRYAYAAQTAWIKNNTGTFVAQPPVTLPVEVSACATGSSCDATAQEVLSTVTYGTSGVANNLLPTSVSQGSGSEPAMRTVQTTYTPDGDVATVDGPLPGADDRVMYRYDTSRRMVGAVGPDPDGTGPLAHRAQRMTYDARGLVTLAETGTTTGYSDPAWAAFAPILKSQTVYDDFGRPIEGRQLSAAGAVSGVQQVTYDAAGRASCAATRMNPAIFGALPTSACTLGMTGGFGPDRISRIQYDALGRPFATTSAYGLPEGITETVSYTPNGLPASLTDGRGNASIMEYDGLDRLSRLRYPNATGGGTSTTDYEAWTYDVVGLPQTARDRSGTIHSYTWDALGRLTDSSSPGTTAGYDNLGRTVSITSTPVSSPASITVNTTYDALSQPISESSSGIGAMSYRYDPAGRMTRITWPDAFYVAYDHDLTGAVTSVRANGATSGSGVLATYSYSDLGQLTGVTRGNGATSSYGYDAHARLTSLAHNPTGIAADLTLGFGYNPAGQIATRTVGNPAYAYASTGGQDNGRNGLNQLTAINSAPVTYDANGNTTGVNTGTGTSTYAYDPANRLTGATAAGGPGASSFTFDPLNRLATTTTGTATTRFQYAGVQLASEHDASGALTRRHIPGLGLDDVIASYTGSDTSSASWLLADERGSVIALTDGTGAANTINRYDDYGVPAPGNTGRFQYTGQAWLAEAGAYHYRARTYLPQTGRFLQTDPIGYQAGMNLYGYVGMDPMNMVDPTGLDSIRRWTVCYGPAENPATGDVVGDVSGGGIGSCSTYTVRTMTIGSIPAGGIFGFSGQSSGSIYDGLYHANGGDYRQRPDYIRQNAAYRRESTENSWMLGPIIAPYAAVAVAALPGAIPAASRLCNCFEAGTLVATPSGQTRIENIRVGDLVLSRDEVTGETAYKPVVALIPGAERQIWEVTVETVDAIGAIRRETIGTTDEHPWRLVGGDWSETAELEPGSEIVTADGRRAVVVSAALTERIERTYNFEVEGFHTYFVGESGLWVHNVCDPSRLTYLYQKVSKLGEHLKIGITSNPLRRYTQRQLAGGRLRLVASGRRDEMLALERHLHRVLPRGREEGF
jgi:RHS repeat-associated protein